MLGLFCFLAGAVGCQTEHALLRKPKATDSTEAKESKETASEVETESSKILDVSSDKPKPFFKASRMPSGLSDEARDIEKDLGIQ